MMRISDRGGRPRRRQGRIWLAVAAMAVLIGSPAGARPIQAPNSRVVLDVPDGYVPASSFSGFQNDALGVSYVIQELPASAYDELVEGFTPEKLASRAILDAEIGTLARPGKHIYIRGRQAQGGVGFEKLILVIKGEAATVLVTANVPRKAIEAKTVRISDVEKVLASASLTGTPNDRALYRLKDAGPFKPAGRFLGTATLYTLDGLLVPAKKGEARSAFIVAPSLDRGPVGNPAELAQRLVKSLAGFKDIEPEEPVHVRIAGLEGIAIAAKGANEGNGHPVRVYQVLLVRPDGGYYRLVGVALAEEAQTLLPEFKRMADSFEPVPPA